MTLIQETRLVSTGT